MGENYSKIVSDLGEFTLEFGEWNFDIDEKVKKIIKEGLMEMGIVKPKNPVKFLGEFLMKYSEK